MIKAYAKMKYSNVATSRNLEIRMIEVSLSCVNKNLATTSVVRINDDEHWPLGHFFRHDSLSNSFQKKQVRARVLQKIFFSVKRSL